jgi:excisionase family DNA binding protein
MMYREILEQSYAVACSHQSGLSRLVYLSESIFDYTTYDSDVAELFARKTIEFGCREAGAVNDILTAAEAAEALRLSMRKVYALAASGELACHRFGSAVRFARKTWKPTKPNADHPPPLRPLALPV